MPCPARNRTRFCKIRNALYVWQQASTPRYAYYRCARLRTIHVRIRIHGMYVYQVRGDTKLNEKVRFIFEMTFSARFSPTSDSAILLVEGRKVQRTDASFFDFQCFDVSFERVFEYSSFFILVLVATCSFLYTIYRQHSSKRHLQLPSTAAALIVWPRPQATIIDYGNEDTETYSYEYMHTRQNKRYSIKSNTTAVGRIPNILVPSRRKSAR